MKSFESRLTIFLSYSFIQRARAGALVLVSLHLIKLSEQKAIIIIEHYYMLFLNSIFFK